MAVPSEAATSAKLWRCAGSSLVAIQRALGAELASRQVPRRTRNVNVYRLALRQDDPKVAWLATARTAFVRGAHRRRLRKLAMGVIGLCGVGSMIGMALHGEPWLGAVALALSLGLAGLLSGAPDVSETARCLGSTNLVGWATAVA